MSSRTLLRALLGLSLALTFGCVGEAGKDGANGADGMNGENGADGANGADGVDGENGADGETGAPGVDGADGANGADGADAACANVPALEITELSGLSDTLYDNETKTVSVVTNAADASSVSLSFAGSGIPATFTDNGDSSFGITLPMLDSFVTDANAIYSVIATDGCSVATQSFTINNISKNAGQVRVINLTGDDFTIWGQMGEGDDATFDKWVSSADAGAQNSYDPYTGDTVVHVFAYAAGTESPADHGEALYVTEAISVSRDAEQSIVIRVDAEGALAVDVITMGAPAEGNFNLAFTHDAYEISYNDMPVADVDLWDLNTGAEIASDLMAGMSYDAIELPAGLAYLGVDLDNDMSADVAFTPTPVLEGVNLHLIAVDDGLGGADIWVSSSNGLSYLPPLDVEALINADSTFPIRVDYENSEGNNSFGVIEGDVNDPSSRILHYAGASSLELTFTTSVETRGEDSCWDYLLILDANGNEVYSGCDDSEEAFTITVEGAWVFIMIDSDFSGAGYYQIDSVVATMDME